MTIRRTTLAVATTAFLALATLAGCASSTTPTDQITLPPDAVPGFTVPASSDRGGSNNPVKIGVVGANNQQFIVLAKEAKAEGIYLDFQDFTEYTQLNPALTSKQLDLNQFQHISYLAKYNNAEKQNLVPIGSTAIYPLGLYSRQYDSVSKIPGGATIAIPDDQTNQARGLAVLQSAGLITLKAGTLSLSAQVSDVDTTTSKVKVTVISADQTARCLDDSNIAAAIINNDYITDTGLSAKDAIAQDDPSSAGAAPYINVWVSRDEDKDLPLFAEIVRLAHSDDWNQALLDNSDGTGVLVNDTAAQLQQVLADTENQLKNS